MPADPAALLRLELPIIVQIGERMLPLRDIITLAPGSIVELGKSSDEDLEVMVNNKVIGAGRAVKVGENFGIRITRVGDAAAVMRAVDRPNAALEPPAPAAQAAAGP